MPTLNLSAIAVYYPKERSPSLQIANLRINQGEKIAITGPSGSGKTTLINILSGLEKPSQGQVIWDNIDLCQLSSSSRDNWRAKHVGLIMQNFHLYPGLNAKENILLPARFHYWRLPKSLTQRADELLEQVGLSHNKRTIENFSRGEIQRVAVARALLSSPPILIADEPTASLDEHNGQQILDLLLFLSKQYQTTLITVTHDKRLAKQINRHIVLGNGLIVNTYKTKEQHQ